MKIDIGSVINDPSVDTNTCVDIDFIDLVKTILHFDEPNTKQTKIEDYSFL